MSAETLGWQDEHLLDHRRRLRNAALVSVAVHGVVLVLLTLTPPRTVPPFPEVLSVDLIAAPPGAAAPAPAAAPRAAPAPPKAPEPAPEPAPKAPPKVAPPPPPPPIAKAPVQALPENAPSKIRKVEPKSNADPRRRPKEKQLSYEDAMAALDDDLGETQSSKLLQPVPESEPEDSTGGSSSRSGMVVSKEMLAWARATTRKIQNNWKGVAAYEGRGLATTLGLELSSSGDVLGPPTVVRSSGDPYFDDNAVRAVMMVSPLPAPPRAGSTVFVFRSEGE